MSHTCLQNGKYDVLIPMMTSIENNKDKAVIIMKIRQLKI